MCERKTSASPRSHAWLRVRVRVRIRARARVRVSVSVRVRVACHAVVLVAPRILYVTPLAIGECECEG